MYLALADAIATDLSGPSALAGVGVNAAILGWLLWKHLPKLMEAQEAALKSERERCDHEIERIVRLFENRKGETEK